MDVRIALTNPGHEYLTIEDDGGHVRIVAHGGTPIQLVLPEGHAGDEILASLAAQISDYLTLQGWTTGDAA